MDSNSLNQLKIDLQKEIGFEIVNAPQLIGLKDAIEVKTNKIISYNTLRRLFGFLESRKPKKETLDILSQYLGYPNYTAYKKGSSKFNDWFFIQKMLLIESINLLTQEDLELIDQNIAAQKNIISISMLIRGLLINKNYSALQRIYSNSKMHKMHDSKKMQMATIVSIYNRNCSLEELDQIIKYLIPYSAFRDCGPFFFIDYTTLNKNYGYLVEKTKTIAKTVSEKLFIQLMLNYKKFYSNVSLEITEEADLDLFRLHPVLHGRFWSVKLMEKGYLDSDEEKRIFTALKKVKVYLFLSELILTLIITNKHEILSRIIHQYYDDLFEIEMWAHKTTDAISLMGNCYCNIIAGDFKQAERNLDLIELENVELAYRDYLGLFYHYLKLVLSFSIKDKSLNLASEQQLNNLINQTNFLKFKTVSRDYILV